MSNVAQIHPMAGRTDDSILGRFAMKGLPFSKPAPREWIDDFVIPRGKATILALDHGQGKTTAILNSVVSAAATGQWTLFGSKDHKRALKCVIVTGEETEEDFTQKLAFDGIPGSLDMARAAIASGHLIIVPLDKIIESTASTERVFGDDGGLTEMGRKLFNELYRLKPDVAIFDTMRSCGSGDYNSELVASQTLSALNLLARLSNAAVIMTAHVTKEGSTKLKIDEKTQPSVLIGTLRGSGQIVSQARHVIVLTRAPEEMFKGIHNLQEGDVKFAAAVKSNLGFPLTGQIFPMIRSKSALTFAAHIDGKTLLDHDKTAKKFTFMKVREVLPKLIFSASISGKPFSMTGAFSPEKLAESTLHEMLPEGATPDIVSSALKSLLAEHHVVQVKTTAGGAPSKYDLYCGPYATAEKENAKATSSTGSLDRDLLLYAASSETESLRDIVDFAVNRGAIAEGAEALCRLEAGDERIPEVGHGDEEVREEVPGMDEMPGMDEGEWDNRVPDGDWEQHDPHHADDDASTADISDEIEHALADGKTFEI